MPMLLDQLVLPLAEDTGPAGAHALLRGLPRRASLLMVGRWINDEVADAGFWAASLWMMFEVQDLCAGAERTPTAADTDRLSHEQDRLARETAEHAVNPQCGYGPAA